MTKPTEKQYIKLILSAGCIVTGETGPHVVPHHVKGFANGWGKVSDFLAFPIRSDLHSLLHEDKGLFEMRHGRELELLSKCIQRAMSEFIPF